MYEKLRDENAALRRDVSGLIQELTRLRIAFDDALTVLNTARARLEASRAPSPFSLDPSVVSPATNDLSAIERQDISPTLYAVAEHKFRQRKIRILSDGTIEADTPEGALRFEDFDHLEEVFNAKWPSTNKK